MEVIYTGLHQSPEQIVETAIQEDVDHIGLSLLSGAHMTMIPRVLDLLKDSNITDITISAGGIIPDEDVEQLKAMGVKGIFGPGTSTEEIVKFVQESAGSD
jgi:methylmalonyl-CoA mutase C-terminal domain/subunit